MTLATPRPHRVLRVVLVTVAVAAVGLGAVGVLGYCSVFGCTLFAQDFEPWGEEAVAARAAAVPAATEFADGAAAGGRVVADATRDGCRTGQNNWKIKDTYSHECEVDVSRLVVLTADRASVGEALTSADATIRALGCLPSGPRGGRGLDGVRAEYWREDNPQVARYGAAGLPSAGYDCPGGRTLEAQPTSASRSRVSAHDLTDGTPFLDDVLADDWYTAQDLRVLRESRAELALVVTVTDGYYRTRF